VLGAAVVALLGAAAADWRAGRVLETWQLRSQLKIDVLGELDAKLMQRIRAELSPQPLLEPQQVPSGDPQNVPSWALAPVTALSADSATGMATADQVVAFRELRTHLLAMAAGLQLGPFTVLVVPLISGSGGSFVARNLAASFTLKDGASAVLIDCNLSHPTQHIALRTSQHAGLLDFLDQPHVNFVPKSTGIRGLYLIPSGHSRSSLREYFTSREMNSLMRIVRESGRFVVLDGPSAKGSPDASALSGLADFVVLVVGFGESRASDIAEAVALFDPAKFAGVVFNERA
jgi:Mrp family chromosome partitioning ATPase